MNRELFPHQVRALDMLRTSLAGGKKRPLLQAPTGFGKTMLAAAIVDGALRKGKRVIFTVPALSLVDQTVDAFWREGIRDVGVIQGAHEMAALGRPVQVASIQTLMRRHIPKADVVVVDEAHKWFRFYGDWMAMDWWESVPFIGLSATPWTKGLGKHYDDLLIAATTADLIDTGYLSPFKVYAPSHPDLKGVRTVAGDYHEGDLSGALDKPKLTADVVETWRRLGEGRPTLCFAVDRAHARHLADQFQTAGIGTGYIDAHTPAEEREAIRRRFHDGSIGVVCSVGCLTTGVDWDVRCIVLARPTKSQMLFVQMIGRGLRTAGGKDHCLILDHSDTHLRLGFVTGIHPEKLDDGRSRRASSRRDKAQPLPKECPSCAFLKPPGVHVCPSCGFAPKVVESINAADGTLSEFTDKKPKPGRCTKQLWFSMLTQVALDRGYKRGWVSHAYRSKFGVWPQGLSDQPVPAGTEVLAYVKHLQIKHARRKAA